MVLRERSELQILYQLLGQDDARAAGLLGALAGGAVHVDAQMSGIARRETLANQGGDDAVSTSPLPPVAMAGVPVLFK